MRFLRTALGLPLASILALACGGTVGRPPGDAAGPRQDAGPSDPCCLNPGLTWATVGGFVAFEESSTIATCDQYSHHRKFPSGGSPALDCAQQMACAADAHGLSDVSSALKDADVTAAIAKAPILYGNDARSADGQILKVTIGSALIQIGMKCGGQPGCVEIPAGVDALATLLRAIDNQQMHRGECAKVFAP